jgi:hypothetical protein
MSFDDFLDLAHEATGAGDDDEIESPGGLVPIGKVAAGKKKGRAPVLEMDDDDSLEIIEQGDDSNDIAAEGSLSGTAEDGYDDSSDSDSDYSDDERPSGSKKASAKRGFNTAVKKKKPAEADTSHDSIEPTAPSAAKKPKKPKLTAEEKAEAKAAKLRAKEEQKRTNAQNRAVEKAGRGGYAREEIALSFEAGFAKTLQGKALSDGLMLEYAVIAPTEVPIPNAIFWRRRKIVGLKNAAVAGKKKAVASIVGADGVAAVNPSENYIFQDDHGKLEPFVCIYWEGSTFVETLLSHGTDAIEEAVIAMRTALEPGTRVIFLIQGAAAYLYSSTERRKALERSASGAGAQRPRLPAVTTQHAYDSALMHLYVARDLEIKETITTQESVEYLRGCTRAIAENPYRATPSALAVVTKVKVQKGGFAAMAGSSSSAAGAGGAASMDEFDDDPYSNYGGGDGGGSAASAASAAGAAAAKVNKQGGGSKGIDVGETWLAMLQMIPGVSKDKALSIVREYPSFRALMDQYSRTDLTEEQKRDLLTDLPIRNGSGKTRIRKISEDCYSFFTSENAEEVIGESIASIKAAAQAAKKKAKAAAAGAAGGGAK